jgi:hypothetical protein
MVVAVVVVVVMAKTNGCLGILESDNMMGCMHNLCMIQSHEHKSLQSHEYLKAETQTMHFADFDVENQSDFVVGMTSEKQEFLTWHHNWSGELPYGVCY